MSHQQTKRKHGFGLEKQRCIPSPADHRGEGYIARSDLHLRSEVRYSHGVPQLCDLQQRDEPCVKNQRACTQGSQGALENEEIPVKGLAHKITQSWIQSTGSSFESTGTVCEIVSSTEHRTIAGWWGHLELAWVLAIIIYYCKCPPPSS